jgi:hypothetical protein
MLWICDPFPKTDAPIPSPPATKSKSKTMMLTPDVSVQIFWVFTLGSTINIKSPMYVTMGDGPLFDCKLGNFRTEEAGAVTSEDLEKYNWSCAFGAKWEPNKDSHNFTYDCPPPYSAGMRISIREKLPVLSYAQTSGGSPSTEVAVVLNISSHETLRRVCDTEGSYAVFNCFDILSVGSKYLLVNEHRHKISTKLQSIWKVHKTADHRLVKTTNTGISTLETFIRLNISTTLEREKASDSLNVFYFPVENNQVGIFLSGGLKSKCDGETNVCSIEINVYSTPPGDTGPRREIDNRKIPQVNIAYNYTRDGISEYHVMNTTADPQYINLYIGLTSFGGIPNHMGTQTRRSLHETTVLLRTSIFRKFRGKCVLYGNSFDCSPPEYVDP